MICKRPYQYGLKGFVVSATACGVLLGLLGQHLQQKRAEEAAVREIRKLGGKVSCSSVFDEKLWFTDTGSSPGLGLAHHFRCVTGVRLMGKRVSDEHLAPLSGLSKLRRLSLGRTGISDEGLIHLSGLTRLEHLDLQETSVGDGALPQLRSLPELRTLNLSRTVVSDIGIGELATYKSLECVVLTSTRCTFEGIRRFRLLNPQLLVHVAEPFTADTCCATSSLGRSAQPPIQLAVAKPNIKPGNTCLAELTVGSSEWSSLFEVTTY